MATCTEIITKFELQVSDVTELSTSEELMVLNRVYNRVMDSRPWEILKTTTTGTVTTDATGSYITLPSDFSYFYENMNWTDNVISTEINQAPKCVWIIQNNNYIPYVIVNYADRIQYSNRGQYCYLDIANSKLVFCSTPITTSYVMDYIKVPAVLLAGSTPIIPTRYQDILVYGMAVEDSILQLSPKAKSYAPENLNLYNNYLADMALWNSNLINN